MLICMLAAYLVWHLRRAWAPLTCTDEDPPPQPDPVVPARRSEAAAAKGLGYNIAPSTAWRILKDAGIDSLRRAPPPAAKGAGAGLGSVRAR